MIDAQKLNDTVKELENEVENIKNISKLIEHINKLSNDITMSNKAYESVINDIKMANEQVHKINENNEIFLSTTIDKLGDINDTIDKRVAEIQNENISFNKGLSEQYSEMETKLSAQVKSSRNDVTDAISRVTTHSNNHIEQLAKKIQKQNIFLYVLALLVIIDIALRYLNI